MKMNYSYRIQISHSQLAHKTYTLASYLPYERFKEMNGKNYEAKNEWKLDKILFVCNTQGRWHGYFCTYVKSEQSTCSKQYKWAVRLQFIFLFELISPSRLVGEWRWVWNECVHMTFIVVLGKPLAKIVEYVRFLAETSQDTFTHYPNAKQITKISICAENRYSSLLFGYAICLYEVCESWGQNVKKCQMKNV